jgi:hypothetical protein
MARWLQSADGGPALAISKYYLPLGLEHYVRRGPPAPQGACRVRDLPRELPAEVDLRRIGEPRPIAAGICPVFFRGRRSELALSGVPSEGEYVARIHEGLVVGRHCAAVDPRGRMICESGFFASPEDLFAPDWPSGSSWRRRRRRREMSLLARRRLPPVRRIDGSAVALNMRCSHNFFHWMIEILPRLTLLRRSGHGADSYLVDCLTTVQRATLAALGVDMSRVVQPHCRLTLQPEALLLPSLPEAETIRQTAVALAAGLGAATPLQGERQLYISRRNARTRRIRHEGELEAFLAARGFEIHCLEDYDLRTQVALAASARTIVAVHGAGLAHLAFAPTGAKVVEIVPAGRYNAALYPQLSRRLGHDHRLVAAERGRFRRRLHVAIDDVHAALDDLGRTEDESRSAAEGARRAA